MKIYDNITTDEHSCSCIANWQRICKGKDIRLSIPIEIDELNGSLSDKDLTIELLDDFGMKFRPEFETNGNVISFRFLGIEQKHLGLHHCRLWLNKDKEGQSMLDINKVFELVRTTEEENITSSLSEDETEVEGVPVKLGVVNISLQGGKSAYQAAVEKGFFGTEEEFNEILANARPATSLDSDDDNKPLAASQGKLLNEKIESNSKWFNLT